MNEIQLKIYDYFGRNSELRVLFIFKESIDTYSVNDLKDAEWKEGYLFVVFQGDWFTTKYKLDNEWSDKKIILYFNQFSPIVKRSLQISFPLMDVLAANMEYHNQDHTAFMQQYGLSLTDKQLVRLVEKNIVSLQSDKMLKLFQPFYQNSTITYDLMIRGFISSFMGSQRIFDWDDIILKVLLYGRESEKQKQLDFHHKLRNCKDIESELGKHLTEIFGESFKDSTEKKVGQLVKIFKYNAIAQNLVTVPADNYKQYQITDSLALQHLNRILELALSQDKTSNSLSELFEEMGSEIHDKDIIEWYGTDANFYYIPQGLCVPIISTLLEEKIETEPESVIKRVEDLILKFNDMNKLSAVMDYAIIVAKLYEKIKGLGSITLNTPNDYITKYENDFSLVDQYYRHAIETFFKIDPSCELFERVQNVKANLDINYSKFLNRLNLEWTRCIIETGGINRINVLKQRHFYQEKISPIQKKVAVIISDALRYEVAQELVSELAKSKHIASIKPALATLPTETKYCKPSLLPYRELKFQNQGDDMNLLVDDQILDSTQKRSDHLQHYREGAICVAFETVAEYNQLKNRDIFKHPVVYIFHDNIDQIGHDGNSKQIIQSCRDTINDLTTLISKILSSYNVTEVYVTSDHGFLFNDIEFAEKDKHKVTEDNLERCSRYYLTKSTDKVAGVVKFPLDEASGMRSEGIMIAVPEGTNRFAAPSGGYMFTHGGASLQEIIIPIITIRQERIDNKQPVDVMLLDRKLSLQASRLRFILLQTEAVSMDRKERLIKIALYHNDEAVSPVKDIVLDKTDNSLEDRKIQVDLTLNKNVNSKVLQLKVYDATDDLNPIIKENVTNNTLIENDFDF